MTYPYILTLIGAFLFFYLFRHWRNKKMTEISSLEISHFSNIGFNNLNEEKSIDELMKKIASDGISVGDWKMMKFGSELEIWIADIQSKDFELQPFYRGSKFQVKSEKLFPVQKWEGYKLLTLDDELELFAEMIPFNSNQNSTVFLTAFGVEVTLYDSVKSYESEVKATFKKQIISLPYLRYLENPDTAVPSAEVIISGIVKEHERKVNPETGVEFWNVKIEIRENFVLDAVWDYRLVDRFPQRGNVLVGNFYLFGSQEDLG